MEKRDESGWRRYCGLGGDKLWIWRILSRRKRCGLLEKCFSRGRKARVLIEKLEIYQKNQ